MTYTQEEKNKIYSILDTIKEYLQTLQPQIRSEITVDFGKMKTYANFDKEREFHLYIDKDEICGRSGGLYMTYERERVSSSTQSSIYAHFDYTTELIQNWQFIKKEILDKIALQNTTILAINNFEIQMEEM